jgi:hypothetical protein
MRISASLIDGHLTYDAAREWLSGVINAKTFGMRAFSGGGRGSIKTGVAQSSLTSQLATTKLIKTGHRYSQRGGTLPPGEYGCLYVAHHRKFGECVRLDRHASATRIASPFASHAFAHGRDNDFFIHGRGPLGSDGCIVPADSIKRLWLNRAVRDHKGAVTLQVINVSYALPAERMDGMVA